MSAQVQFPDVLVIGLSDDLFFGTIERLPAALAVRRCSNLQDLTESVSPSRAAAVVVIGVGGDDSPESLTAAYQIRDQCPTAHVIFVVNFSSEALMLGALRAGVAEYLKAPVTGLDIADAIRRFLPSGPDTDDCAELIGSSPAMREIKDLIRRVATMNSTILITGETGTGKEVAARLIHELSGRSEKPLVCVNGSAIPDTLLESELFGYEKGAFTGAVARQPGQFRLADGGTLFLDEIGDMSPLAQSKVLRAIEQHEVQPLGGSRPVPVDIRIIAATHQDLEQLVHEGKFRSDLFYRLHIVRLVLPSLRERAEDIPALARHFLRQVNREQGRAIEDFTPSAIHRLSSYHWPGNVRQLRNAVEAAALMCDSRRISETNLRTLRFPVASQPMPMRMTAQSRSHLSTVSESERLKQALEATQWNVTRTAELLCWSRVTVYRKVAKYQLGRNLQAV